MSSYPGTRRAARASKIALFVLWAAFAAIAYNVYTEVAELALIDDLEQIEARGDEYYSDATLARIDANEERQRRGMIAYGAAIVFGTIGLLFWVSRTNKACHELGAPMRFTPGWAWGYWLVPFLNLVRPFQVVQELWVTTDPDRRSSPLIGWWWAAWLATGFVSRFADNGMSAEAGLDEFRRADHILLFSHALDIVGFALTIVLVTRLTARLAAFRDRVALAEARVVS